MPHSSVTSMRRERTRSLRRAMTRSETLLWRYIKSHRIDGLGFRRQEPVGPYIADFICHQAQLIIESDGGSHDFKARQPADTQKDNHFRSPGYRPLRFKNQNVMTSLEGVVRIIRDSASPTPPSLTLALGQGVYARLKRAMGGGNGAEIGATGKND